MFAWRPAWLAAAAAVALLGLGGVWIFQSRSVENVSADPSNRELVQVGRGVYGTPDVKPG